MRIKKVSPTYHDPFEDCDYRLLTLVDNKGNITEFEILVPEPDFLDEDDHEFKSELPEVLSQEMVNDYFEQQEDK